MGYLLKPECKNGHEYKEIHLGGGMDNFEYSCEVPFFCEKCESIKVKNLFKKKKYCKLCKLKLKLDVKELLETDCEECKKLNEGELFNFKHNCGKCKSELKMYGKDIGYFDDENSNVEEMRNLEDNSYNWSYFIDRTYYLPHQNNYCPKCKKYNLDFHFHGIWD